MIASISAFFGDVPFELAQRYLCTLDPSKDCQSLDGLSRRKLGRAFTALVDTQFETQLDQIRSDCNAMEEVSKAGVRNVILPACAEDTELIAKVDEARSDRERALLLFLHNKPRDSDTLAFRRAWALADCGAGRPQGRTWILYDASKLSRNWTPVDIDEDHIRQLVSLEFQTFEKISRDVHIDTFSRPVFADAPDGPSCFTILINASGPTQAPESWSSGELGRTVYRPNRRICIVVSPHQKTVEFGRDDLDHQIATKIFDTVSSSVLGFNDMSIIQPGEYDLSRLTYNSAFKVLPEHRIRSVSVRKLVLVRGRGTLTYHVPAKFDANVYDLFGAGSIAPSQIIGAGFRVEFYADKPGVRRKNVNFEITRPNKCNLKETSAEETLLLDKYLDLWGLRRQPERGFDPPPLGVRIALQPFKELLQHPEVSHTKSSLLDRLGRAMNDLVDSHILKSVGAGTIVACPSCSEGRFITVNDQTGVPECDLHGPQPVDAEHIQAFKLDMDGFAVFLASILNLDTSFTRKIDNNLFVLGVSRCSAQWTAIFAPKLSNAAEIDRVIALLRRGVGKSPGILLSSNELSNSHKIPNKHRPIVLDDLLEVKGDGIRINDAVLSDVLGKTKQANPPGRPNYREEGKAIQQAYESFWMDPTSEQILATLRLVHPDAEDLPSLKTVRYDWEL